MKASYADVEPAERTAARRDPCALVARVVTREWDRCNALLGGMWRYFAFADCAGYVRSTTPFASVVVFLAFGWAV